MLITLIIIGIILIVGAVFAILYFTGIFDGELFLEMYDDMEYDYNYYEPILNSDGTMFYFENGTLKLFKDGESIVISKKVDDYLKLNYRR